ncbi:TPA: retron system putative HNH endonuclease [Photobacterium damselae]
MYPINKSVQPESLRLYRLEEVATYKAMPEGVRRDLVESLLTEQGHVCAYCMKRIKAQTMRVEHWASRQDNPELQLEYSNLIACCEGNEGQPKDTYTCDKKKANETLKFSPSHTRPKINTKIDYHEGGKIKSGDPVFHTQLDTVLNLNESRLVSNRIAALKAIQSMLNTKKGIRKRSEIQKLLDRVLTRNSKNQHREYFGFLANYLEKKL